MYGRPVVIWSGTWKFSAAAVEDVSRKFRDRLYLLASERDRDKLLRHILMAGKRICNADAATLYLKTEGGGLRFALRSRSDSLPSVEIPLIDPHTGLPDERHVCTHVALHNQSVLVDDVYAEARFDLSGTRHFDLESGYRTVSMLAVPMAPAPPAAMAATSSSPPTTSAPG